MMKFKIIKRRILEYVSDFAEEIYDRTIGSFKISQSKKIGEWFAIPKKYYSKILNNKEITNLGIPYFNTGDGGTIFVKSYKYKFQGRERTTEVITTLGKDNKVIKSVIQTPGIPFCYRLEGKKLPAYGVTQVFDSKGNKINHILKQSEYFEGSKDMMHKFSSTTDDGLRLHIRRYNGGCSCVGEPGERLAVNFGPKDDFIRRSMYFAGKDRFKNAKTYIEQVRISNNSLRSKYIRKHSLMQSSLRVT